MTLPLYLALTPSEMAEADLSSCHAAWMACHFSADSPGLSNLPRKLPEHSVILLDDSYPPQGHDPVQVRRELADLCEFLQCAALVLDFQRAGCPETRSVVQAVAEDFPCKVLVSEKYAHSCSCGVFLSSPPLHVPTAEYLVPWKGREIWLEAAPDGEEMMLTKDGCTLSSLADVVVLSHPMEEPRLHCSYEIETGPDFARFRLYRDQEHLYRLLEEAETLGVTGAIGLYQQLGRRKKVPAEPGLSECET